MKKIVAVIPARMAASRFPGKPLVRIAGLPLIEHVRRRSLLAPSVHRAVVATCDQEILETVRSYGGEAVMTAATHERCTDRVEEAARDIDLDVALIVQGDEPIFFPDCLEALLRPMVEDPSVVCTNILSTIKSEDELNSTDVVKTLLKENGDVLCYSRLPLPFRRVRSDRVVALRQTGISAFTKSFLKTFQQLPETGLEIVESVDFLRILGHSYPIRGVVLDQITQGVDRPEDVAKVERILTEDAEQAELFARIKQA